MTLTLVPAPDAPKSLESLCKAPPRELALRMHRNEGWLIAACKPISIPYAPSAQQPDRVARALERSGAIAENTARLRGLLWNCVALQRCVDTDPSDSEAEEALHISKRMLIVAWKLADVPASLSERNQLAVDTVERMARGGA